LHLILPRAALFRARFLLLTFTVRRRGSRVKASASML
jgi:hypothetical protein